MAIQHEHSLVEKIVTVMIMLFVDKAPNLTN